MQTTGPWHAGEMVAFDLETTGVDRFTDVPVSFALVHVVDGKAAWARWSYVDPGRAIPPPATAVHGITDERVRAEGMEMSAAVGLMAEALLDASSRGVPVVGMKLDFDLTMLDACYRREVGHGLADDGFRGPVLDALVLDRHFDQFRPGKRTLGDLCAHYGVVIDHAHDAVADARASVEVVAAMCRRFPELCACTPEDLHWAQMDWHREWSMSFSRWRLRKGLVPTDDDHGDDAWPIACERPSEGMARAAG